MVDIVPLTPCVDLLPVTVGQWHLRETEVGRLTTVAPFAGQQDSLSEAMEKAHGLSFPAPNETSANGAARAIWFGRDMALLAGPEPDVRLADHAALTDQSDAWAAVTLAGPGTDEVLARLVPVDLRTPRFGPGRTCRTTLGHMHASITRLPGDSFLLLVFRSMAVTLVDELHEAMEAVVARG